MQKLSIILSICLIVSCSVRLKAQVPIDLSQAREFKLVWKMPWGGTVIAPKYLKNFCGVPDNDVLVVGSTLRGVSTCRTRPQLDTNSIGFWMGVLPEPFDYDGNAPMEYINQGGHVMRCERTEPPISMPPIDTISCWSGGLNASFSGDVDGDGYADLICDVGGGGYTARVILGGLNFGNKCERIFYIPRVIGRNAQNFTRTFWQTTSGRWRLLQQEQDSNALSPWLVLYDVVVTRVNNKPIATFIQTDSLYGNGIDKADIPIGDCAGIADTLARKDWLLVMRRLDDNQRTWVLERFDATVGKFTPTGEQVTGVEFYEPWNAGYTLGTSKPVVAFHASNVGRVFCYADNLRHPFALWFPKGALQPPVSGMIAINDQTGDGNPDVLAVGGGTDGAIALYTLDSTSTSANEQIFPAVSAEGRMIGDVLELTLSTTVTVSAQLITTDGRVFPALSPTQGNVELNRFDLSPVLRTLPVGAYILRIRYGEWVLTINLIR